MVALWAMFFVTTMAAWIAMVDLEAAVAASIFASSCVWFLCRDAMTKRLKNHAV
jgi:hypothetical protein